MGDMINHRNKSMLLMVLLTIIMICQITETNAIHHNNHKLKHINKISNHHSNHLHNNSQAEDKN